MLSRQGGKSISHATQFLVEVQLAMAQEPPVSFDGNPGCHQTRHSYYSNPTQLPPYMERVSMFQGPSGAHIMDPAIPVANASVICISAVSSTAFLHLERAPSTKEIVVHVINCPTHPAVAANIPATISHRIASYRIASHRSKPFV